MKLDPNHALVVLSGGQDSTICLGWALSAFPRVSAVTFDYGQHHDREINAAIRVVAFFKEKTGRDIEHEIVRLGEGILESTSPLTNHGAGLEQYASHDQMERIIGDRVEKTFVPMRNPLFFVIAANRAVAIGSRRLITGVCQEDNANYPDCRAIFVSCAENMITSALGLNQGAQRFFISAPLMYLTKAESINMALDLGHTYSALQFSHTAYDGAYPPTGNDHASVLRAHGFAQAGVPDPLILRAVAEGRMPMPDAPNYSPASIDAAVQRLRGSV